MPGLATPPGFGRNSWDESQWAAAMAANLAPFRVAGPTSWKPSIAPGLDRGIALAPGGGWAYGVWDRTDTIDTVQCAANTGSTDRYDLVVARWTWSTGRRVFAVLQGTSSPPAINTTALIDSAKVNRIPGSRYEAIIAVVRVRPGVGTIAATDLTDMRVWGGQAGPLRSVSTEDRRDLLDAAEDTEILFNATGRIWRRTADSWTYVGGGNAPTSRIEYNGALWKPADGLYGATVEIKEEPRCWLNADGSVHATGAFASVAELTPRVYADTWQLPAGFRPPVGIARPAMISFGAGEPQMCRVDITPIGSIGVNIPSRQGAGVLVSFDWHFRRVAR